MYGEHCKNENGKTQAGNSLLFDIHTVTWHCNLKTNDYN